MLYIVVFIVGFLVLWFFLRLAREYRWRMAHHRWLAAEPERKRLRETRLNAARSPIPTEPPTPRVRSQRPP